MFQSTTSSILPIRNPELTEQSKSSNYSWKTLTKASLVFVTTTGAFLALKTTGSFSLISSWLKNKGTDFNEQETDLAITGETEGIEAYSGHLDFKESSLATAKDSQHAFFMPRRAKRSPTGTLEKIGPEFQVNTYTAYNQRYPSVAELSDGKFVVTWASGDSLLAPYQDGSGYGIYGQMFNADGSRYLSEFQVNTYTAFDQLFPSVADLNGGKFVVTWQSDNQDGDEEGIYGQMFNADGSKYDSEFQVNTYTAYYQRYPSLAGLNDGKFVVTWDSFGQDGSWSIYGQMYNANGTKYLSEFQVNTYTIGQQLRSSVARLSNGKFVVTWGGPGNGDGIGVYYQMYNANGTKYLSEFQVNTYTIGGQSKPSIAGLSDGKFVVTWHSVGQDGDVYGIYGQVFNANGTKYLSEFQVNTYTTDDQEDSSVAGLSDGKFVVTWESWWQDGSDSGVYGQMFNTDGTKFLSEFLVNTCTLADQSNPSVAGLSDGKFVVTWHSYAQDGDVDGVYGQMFVANETLVSSYSSSSQQIPESSSVFSSYGSTASSLKASNSIVPDSSIESSSSLSDQSVSSMQKSSTFSSSTRSKSQSKLSSYSSDIASQTNSSKSSLPISSIESQSLSSQSSYLLSSISMSSFFSSRRSSLPVSTTKSSYSSEQSESTSTQKTPSSTSVTKEESSNSAFITSAQSQELSSSETGGANSMVIILGAIIGGVSVILCIGGGVGCWLYRRKGHVELDEIDLDGDITTAKKVSIPMAEFHQSF